METTILVVEDDEEIAGLLRFNLENRGYRVVTAEEGYEALALAKKIKPDLILLDLMLPEMDGLEVCRALRNVEGLKNVPVIMLTAKGDEVDIVVGLELGADDYVTKPFSVKELLARIKAHLRRNGRDTGVVMTKGGCEDTIIKAGEIILKPEEHKVYVRGMPVNLSYKEFELLKFLMLNKGKVLKRNFLLEHIWGYDTEIDTRTVDVHIRYLRQKIEEDPANPQYIQTVRGVGYSLQNR